MKETLDSTNLFFQKKNNNNKNNPVAKEGFKTPSVSTYHVAPVKVSFISNAD